MEYEYKGLPLTPKASEGLILELFSGKQEKRDNIIKAVINEHKKREGADATAQDVDRLIKRGLENLRKQEIVSKGPYMDIGKLRKTKSLNVKSLTKRQSMCLWEKQKKRLQSIR
jgi:hypothetical protein